MDRRVSPGLVAGVGGLAAGAGAAVLGSPVLACLAGVAALVAGGSAVTSIRARLDPAAGPPATLLDRRTGLPTRAYFALAVHRRTRSARRHVWPVTIAVVEVVYRREHAGGAEAVDAATTASVLQRVVRDADEIAVLRPGCFGLVFDDAGEPQAVATIDRLEATLAAEVAGVERLAAGIATYPSTSVDADDLVARAEQALATARAAPAGRRVVVASGD